MYRNTSKLHFLSFLNEKKLGYLFVFYVFIHLFKNESKTLAVQLDQFRIVIVTTPH